MNLFHRRLIRRAAGLVSLPVLCLVVAQVVLAAPPSAEFSISDATPEVGQSVTFDSARSTDADGDIALYEWDFAYEEGSFSPEATGTTATQTFSSSGRRLVALRVTDTDAADGTVDEVVVHQSVNVAAPPNVAPTAVIACSTELVNPGTPVNCTSAGSGDADGTISEYQWAVDSGSFSDGGETFSMPLVPGSHTIRLRVRDNVGALSPTVTASVAVNAPPTAAIAAGAAPPSNLPTDVTVNAAVNQGVPVPLVGQVVQLDSSGSNDPGGSIASRAWDVDDNGFDDGTDVTLNRAFTTAGQKTVRLRVTDDNGATSVESVSFRVNSLPSVGFIADNPTPVIDQSVSFFSTSSDPDNDISAYSWDFDNDGQFGESSQSSGITCQSPQSPNASCRFANAGTYRISLRVTDAGGVSRVARRQVLIQSTVPRAAFSFSPDSPLPGQAVTLSSTSTPSGGKVLTAYEWDLNYDGVTFTPDANGPKITHHFWSTGPKTVALRVSERMPGGGPATGGFAIVARTVTVNAPPTAALRISAPTPFVGDAVTLSSAATDPDGPITSQTWDLDGDGQFDDAAGPVVSASYPSPGPRRVQLRVTDSRGAVAITSGVIDVRARPLTVLSGVVIGIKGSVRGRVTRLRRLNVKAPAGAMITVRCRATRCPKRLNKRGTGRAIRLRALERKLRAGTKVIITVTKAGVIGKQTTYTMRRGRGPKRVDLCLVPGAPRATTCPT